MPIKRAAISAARFNAVLKRLELSVYASRRVLGISLSQAQRYSAGHTPIPLTIARLLELLLEHGIPDHWRKPDD